MKRIQAQSDNAQIAYQLVEELQAIFVDQLDCLAGLPEGETQFSTIEWFRNQGRHGGGVRYVANDEALFNRASINVSQVQYDDDDEKLLSSATAISSIVHPRNPHAPSVHMHISWTEMKQGKGYWRLMADLNPAIEEQSSKDFFKQGVSNVLLEHSSLAADQGDKYFYIPAIERHRGVVHYYLENFNTGDQKKDLNLARVFGKAVINFYVSIFHNAIKLHPAPAEFSYSKQLAYHTLYLFQVLTLDRGTTSGLLVHDQNDLGIMGSLPRYIDRSLLKSWVDKMSSPQDALLDALLVVLPNSAPCEVDDSVKLALAKAVRSHYQKYPEAIKMQAQGYVVPDTVDNHK